MIVYAGEFGIVYKARLVNWHEEGLSQPVAVKTMKGVTNSKVPYLATKHSVNTHIHVHVPTHVHT